MSAISISEQELMGRLGDVPLYFSYYASGNLYFDGEHEKALVSVLCVAPDTDRMHFGVKDVFTLKTLNFVEVNIISKVSGKSFRYQDPEHTHYH